MTKLESVLACHNRLGEGPCWSSAEQALFWVDILAPAVHRWHPASGEHRRWPVPEHVGCLALRQDGGLVLALKSGFATLDPADGAVDVINPCEAHLPDNRFNDGRCDRAGRFWAGSLPYDESTPQGTLWRLEADHSAHPVLGGIMCPNSLCWSPDGRTMYFADTPTREIKAYDFDLEAGVPANPRRFARIDGTPGWPDGSTVDSEGFLWNAEWDGARVVRYAPDGAIDRVVEVPARRPTCCAFGGPDLETLYITSAWDRMSEAERTDWPLSGNLFAFDPGVAGLPETPYRG